MLSSRYHCDFLRSKTELNIRGTWGAKWQCPGPENQDKRKESRHILKTPTPAQAGFTRSLPVWWDMTLMCSWTNRHPWLTFRAIAPRVFCSEWGPESPHTSDRGHRRRGSGQKVLWGHMSTRKLTPGRQGAALMPTRLPGAQQHPLSWILDMLQWPRPWLRAHFMAREQHLGACLVNVLRRGCSRSDPRSLASNKLPIWSELQKIGVRNESSHSWWPNVPNSPAFTLSVDL